MKDGVRRRCQFDGGGLGVRSAVLLAPSAYLASAASTTELASSLLPVRLRDTVDSGICYCLVTTGTLATAEFTDCHTDLNSSTILGRSV